MAFSQAFESFDMNNLGVSTCVATPLAEGGGVI